TPASQQARRSLCAYLLHDLGQAVLRQVVLGQVVGRGELVFPFIFSLIFSGSHSDCPLQRRFQPLHKLPPRRRVEGSRFAAPIDPHTLQPRKELRRRTQLEEASRGQRVVIAGGLVIQHHIVGTGNPHEVIAARSRQEQHQVVS